MSSADLWAYVAPADRSRLLQVEPELARRAVYLIAWARYFGADLAIVAGYRSQLEQERLYAQGRTTPGPIVTWTRNSAHTRGQAIDVAFRNRGSVDYNVPASAWEFLGKIGAYLGLKRPAASKGDLGHFELA